jgi:N-acetyl-gamma-glutamyl-phosphate reductase
MKAAILGATGYVGMVLLRLLQAHPQVESVIPVSRSQQGELVSAGDRGFPAQGGKFGPTSGRYVSTEEALALKPDVVFSALPHLASAEVCRPFIGNSVVFDLSADLRLKNPEDFLNAYGEPSPFPDLSRRAVYGLAEIYREEIAKADLVAVPGCYPTATLLPLLPVLAAFGAEGLVTVNALSGVSGAGRKVKENYLFCRRTENCGAYAPGRSHRHIAEMVQESSAVASEIDLIFTPHLVPLHRGMAVTTSLRTCRPVSDEAIAEALRSRYAESPCVYLTPGHPPETADVRGTNRCDISWYIDGRDLFLFSAIDNLMKGAAGQAVQCMNIRHGFGESEGLPLASMV